MKGWAPADYYNKPAGERDLIWALASYEYDNMWKEDRTPTGRNR